MKQEVRRERAHVLDVLQTEDLGGETTVDTEELLVHDGRQWEAVKRVHTRIIHSLRVLDLTCKTNRTQSVHNTNLQNITHQYHITYSVLKRFYSGQYIIAEMCITYMLCIHWHSSVVQ